MEPAKQSPLSSVELREVRRVACRAERSHEDFNAAEPQALRERLWRDLTGEFDLDLVRAIYPLIISARRIALNEWIRAQERGFTMEQQSAIARDMYGEFPPVRPLDAPPKPVDI